MDGRVALLRHFLAVIAYRFERAAGGAPDTFGDFEAGHDVRRPSEIVRHMTRVLQFAAARVAGNPPPESDRNGDVGAFVAEVQEFHAALEHLSGLLDQGTNVPAERLLQGPLSDVMTHVGQLAMLRRIAGSPVPPESFFSADIRADRLGADQAAPAEPFRDWPERPRN